MKLIEFTTDDNNCFSTNSTGLKKKLNQKHVNVLLCNIRSMRQNFNHLMALIQSTDVHFSVIILNETQLDDGEEVAYNLNGYDMHSRNRNRFGGGLIIFSDNTLRSEYLNHLTGLHDNFESLFINIRTKTGKITIGTIYRPPSGSINSFSDELELKILNKLPRNKTIIMGDTNIDLLAEANNSNLKFVTSLNDRNFDNHINKVTRDVTMATGSSATIIDHIWSTAPIKKYFAINHSITDHYPIGCSLQVVPEGPVERKISYRNFSDENLESFKRDFIAFKKSLSLDISNRGEINLIFQLLIVTLANLISKHFPIIQKTLRNKELKPPWIDKDLLKFIDKKNKIYQQFRMGKTSFNTYKRFRNLLNKTLKIAKKCFFVKKFKDLKGSPRECWKKINTILKPLKTPSEIKKNDKLVDNPDVTANMLNRKFDQSDSTAASNIDSRPRITPNEKSFVFFEVMSCEIAAIIVKMKNNNKNTSEIPTLALKYIVTDLSELLAVLFNICILQGTFPDPLKYSEITPIPKKGCKFSIKNYRPISILNPITKIFENLIHDRLHSFFNKFQLITPYQFGFRKGRDISQAALNLLYHINESNKNNETAVATFIDFSRAFDSINRELLLQKLELYGIRGVPLQLLRSYFTNRFQLTKINSYSFQNSRTCHKSIWPHSQRGTPQGSALGPLFFSIFINDIVKEIKHSTIFLYADDVVIINSGKDNTILSNNTNEDMSIIYSWSCRNELPINFDKTKCMTFTRKRNVALPIIINNKIIENVPEFTYLGLLIDKNLSFRNHILNIVKKVNAVNRTLYSLKLYLPIYILKKIYFSMVHCHLIQHLISWGGTNQTALYPLRTAVNKVIRNIHPGNISTSGKYKELNILNLTQLYQSKLCETMFKILITKNSPLLTNIISNIEWTHNYNTRKRNEFKLPKINTEMNRRFFLTNALKAWENLPDDLKKSKTFLTFKSKVKLFLMNEII